MNDIRMKDVSIRFPVRDGYVDAVDSVSGVFHAGEITGIIGESGCGKSVLGMGLLGLLPANAIVTGSMWLGERQLSSMTPGQMRQVRGREIGLIAQNPADSLNPVRKIRGQLMESIRLNQLSRGAEIETAKKLLISFGFLEDEVTQVLNSFPFQLSGGMQQRVAAAMGAASGAAWVLADEPSKGLDIALREQMCSTLRQVKTRGADGLIIITHDIALAETLCDRVAVMYSGQIIERGSHVLESPGHPYTKALLASLPARGMQPMKGIAPAPGDKSEGCRFAPRCSVAKPGCSITQPGEYGDADEMVRCFRYD